MATSIARATQWEQSLQKFDVEEILNKLKQPIINPTKEWTYVPVQEQEDAAGDAFVGDEIGGDSIADHRLLGFKAMLPENNEFHSAKEWAKIFIK